MVFALAKRVAWGKLSFPAASVGEEIMTTETMKRCADKAQALQPTSDTAWIDVEALRDDAVLTQEEETAAALAEMRRDRTAHLASTLLRHLAAGVRGEEIAGAVIPHLGTCTWCSQMLRDTLRLTGVPEESLSYAILEDAEEWARWDAVGRTAAETACRTLMEHGIGYVYGRDGSVYRRQPDGQEILLHEAEPSAL